MRKIMSFFFSKSFDGPWSPLGWTPHLLLACQGPTRPRSAYTSLISSSITFPSLLPQAPSCSLFLTHAELTQTCGSTLPHSLTPVQSGSPHFIWSFTKLLCLREGFFNQPIYTSPPSNLYSYPVLCFPSLHWHYLHENLAIEYVIWELSASQGIKNKNKTKKYSCLISCQMLRPEKWKNSSASTQKWANTHRLH